VSLLTVELLMDNFLSPYVAVELHKKLVARSSLAPYFHGSVRVRVDFLLARLEFVTVFNGSS
jgi:hypothetical protein